MSLKKALWLCCIATVLAVSSAVAYDLNPTIPDGYNLVWQDEFNGSSLGSTWETWYGMDSYSVGGGTLNMTVYTDPISGENRGAHIATQNGYRQKYGYFVARMKFDDKQSTSSAFWMLSPSMESDNTDPAVSGTEIDIIEHWQSERNTAHFRVWAPYATGLNVGDDAYVYNLDNGDYHLLALRWTPTAYEFYVDNRLRYTCNEMVSQRSEYLLFDHLSMAEGDFGPLGSDENAHFTVDYVRAYALPVTTRLIYGVTASASSDEYGKVQQLVNYAEDSSKYDPIDNYVHSSNDQWNTDNGVTKQDTWLKFDLGRKYSDIELDVFNSASSGEGAKRRFVSADIWYALNAPTVDNPTDAASGNWMKFADDYAFSEATPYDPTIVNPYTTPTLLSLAGVSAQYVLFNDIENGGVTTWGNSYALNTVVFRGTSVPEPHTVLMLCIALFGLPSLTRRIRKRTPQDVCLRLR